MLQVGAYRVAIAATVGNMVCLTAVIMATFGTFLVPIALDFHWPRAAVSGVLGLISIVSALAYPFIGRAIDRFGARPLLIGGHVALGLLVMSLSLASRNPVLFYCQFGAVGLAGAVCSAAMFSKVVANWFDGNRGLMLGITAGCGNGIGATIMPVVAGMLLPALGWRHTYLALGALMLAFGLPVLLAWLREAPPAGHSPAVSGAGHGPAVSGAGHGPAAPGADSRIAGVTLGAAMRQQRFWLLLVAVASGAGCLTAVFAHVVPMLTDRGLGLGAATAQVAIFALVTAAWQMVMGGLLDRRSTPRLLVPMYVAAIAGLLGLEFGHGSAWLSLASVLLGIGMGAEYAALSYFASRYFGLGHYGAIIGVFYAAVILMQGLTPALMDLSFDATGSYAHAAIGLAAALAAGIVLLLLLPAADHPAPANIA